MKPSPAAPWTLEDAMVWRRFELTIGDLAVWRYVHADRIDAAGMLRAGLWRKGLAPWSDDLDGWCGPTQWYELYGAAAL